MRAELYFPGPARDAYEASLRAEADAFIAKYALGHIYVVEFTSGVVKVGKAANPKARLATHTQLAEVHGGGVKSSWISRRLVAYADAERDLIMLCSRRGRLVAGREYFAIDAAEARTYASIIDHTRLRADEAPAELIELLDGEAVPS